jgi:hypothetical protein
MATGSRRHERFIIALLLSLSSWTAYAQRVPAAGDVRARLHSSDPADVAWAAFDAATFQLREVVPDLIAALESPASAQPQARDYVVAAVLDALIQLRGGARFPARTPDPSPATLQPYYNQFRFKS